MHSKTLRRLMTSRQKLGCICIQLNRYHCFASMRLLVIFRTRSGYVVYSYSNITIWHQSAWLYAARRSWNRPLSTELEICHWLWLGSTRPKLIYTGEQRPFYVRYHHAQGCRPLIACSVSAMVNVEYRNKLYWFSSYLTLITRSLRARIVPYFGFWLGSYAA